MDKSNAPRPGTKHSVPFWNNPKVVPYLYIAPNIILFSAFMIIPIFATIYYSMTSWKGIGIPKFIGLENYLYIFQDTGFLTSVWVTILFTLFTVPLVMLLALTFAVLLNRKIRFRAIYRTALYITSVISTVVVGMVFGLIFSPQIGLITYILSLFGLPSIDWFTDPKFAMTMIVLGTIWSRTGYNMVIYLAGMQDISPEYYEAAEIDGASGWQQFKYITFPLLNFTHIFVMITCVIHSFRSFDLIYVLTKGGPLNATKTLVMYVYDTAFVKNYFGRASAGGVVLFLAMVIFTVLRLQTEKEG